MARNFTHHWTPHGTSWPASGQGKMGVVPTTLRPAVALNKTTDTAFVIEFIVPVEFTGSGTLKLGLYACSATTTAADDAQIDVATEAKTPDAGTPEALNADNFDATADSGTFTFSTTAYSLHLLTITLTPVVAFVAGDLGRIRVTRDADHATLDDLDEDLLVVAAEFYEEV